MNNNVERFFSKMYEGVNVMYLSLDSKYREDIDDIRANISVTETMYSVLYFQPKISIPETGKVKEIVEYLKLIYDLLKEGRKIFVDTCIHAKLDEISMQILMLIYELKLKK